MPRGHKVLVYLAISILSDNIPTFDKAQRGTVQKNGSTSVSVVRTFFLLHPPTSHTVHYWPAAQILDYSAPSAINCTLQ